MVNRMLAFFRRDVVLCAAFVLAVGSTLIVPPDKAYSGYVDLQALAILFCLMSVMACLWKIGRLTRCKATAEACKKRARRHSGPDPAVLLLQYADADRQSENLYLYGRAGLPIPAFMTLMLPYTVLSLALLVGWAVLPISFTAEQITRPAKEPPLRQNTTRNRFSTKPKHCIGKICLGSTL